MTGSLDEVDQEAQLAIQILKDTLLMYLISQQGGVVKVLPKELDAFADTRIEMGQDDGFSDDQPLFTFTVKANT